MPYPFVHEEYATIKKIIRDRVGIARYGDGELKLCNGGSAKSQKADRAVQSRLQDILAKANTEHCIVGIPNICNHTLIPRKEEFWQEYRKPKWVKFYNLGIKYYSSFVTRPDASPMIQSNEYWELVKNIWYNRRVVLLQGAETNFDKTKTLFTQSRGVVDLRGPVRDSYDEYQKLMNMCIDAKTSEEDLIVLALGPTATIMAYDLSNMGHQAVDLGHFGMFYAKYREIK